MQSEQNKNTKSNYNSKYRTNLKLPKDFEIYSSMEVIDYSKIEYKGFVITNLTKSRNVFSTMGAGFKSIVGGNIKAFTYLTNNTRNEVIAQLILLAKEKEANAIIGLRCDVTELAQGILDFVAYGTAVKFER